MMQKPKILAADNTKVALRYMETILGDIYDVTLVQTGMSVLDCLKSEIPDLILMNANMFGMDGYEVLRRIKEDKETKEIPVILMMNVKDIQSELRGLEEGAIDFISLPFEPQVLKARIAHIVELSVLRKQQAHLIAKQKEQIDRLFLQSMVTIAHTVDAKDRYARRHSLRVALYCRGIAAKLGYSDKEKEALYYIALLHDIGKVSTPDTILNKASGLTKEEYENVKKHAEIGAQIVQNTRFVPGLEEGVRYHHEWYDGNGYVGICGDEIPEVSRIIAVADAYEAMTADRAYRKHFSKEYAIQELIRGRGTQFDPEIVDAFLELLEERAIATFGKIKNNGKTVSSNVDFYSGFVYEMIGLPQEIYTPLFAMARIVGWCAHRNEELNFEGKRIIRPAYKAVAKHKSYTPLSERD